MFWDFDLVDFQTMVWTSFLLRTCTFLSVVFMRIRKLHFLYIFRFIKMLLRAPPAVAGGQEQGTAWPQPPIHPTSFSPTHGAPVATTLSHSPYSDMETWFQSSLEQRRHVISYFHPVRCSWWLSSYGNVSFTSSIRLLSLWLTLSPPVFPSISRLQTQ